MAYKEEHKIPLKTAKVNDDVKWQVAQSELKGDMKSYFMERDKTNRGIGGKIEDTAAIAKEEAAEKNRLYMESQKLVTVPEQYSPMFNQVFLSAKRNKTQTDSGLLLPSSMLVGGGGKMSIEDVECDFENTQYIMAKGPQVQQVEVGMEVKLNFKNFETRQKDNRAGGEMRAMISKSTIIDIPVVIIEGVEYLKISERDIDYIINTNTKRRVKTNEANSFNKH